MLIVTYYLNNLVIGLYVLNC